MVDIFSVVDMLHGIRRVEDARHVLDVHGLSTSEARRMLSHLPFPEHSYQFARSMEAKKMLCEIEIDDMLRDRRPAAALTPTEQVPTPPISQR